MKLENFNEYQRESRRTWNVIPMDHLIVYPTMGLANEVGEVAGKITEGDRQAVKGELGDVLWYLTQMCTELNLTLEEMAEANLAKLFSRLERDRIRGDGDDR